MPVEVIDTIKPANGNTFPVADVVDLKGVDQNFADVAERDAFDPEKLVVGQRARTRADSKTWEVTSLDPVVWTEVAAGSGAVSSVAGRTGDVVLSTADISGLGNSATRDVGTAAGTVAAGDDSRLINARTPTAHAASHASIGSDPISPAAIGAEVAGAASTAVAAHTIAADPHGDRAFATSAVSTHTAAADPHGDRAFATTSIATHAAAADPHGDRAFATSAVNTHAALTQVHGESAFNSTFKTSSTSAAARTALGLPASATRTITHSSSPPSGGVAGDIHFQIP